ncbi:hypothetical protein [Aliihoeflea sp. 40Bstr573]|uniref:hypothetical protein n=1 Tax=Aliihoeflea sp. 40Bstr573 TaxID=2696467 RepID=UPI0020958047|nr:hypothetical protein [Aliihoeflea sp. 40Bstr573]MCO6386383.1 hypothetical protein [Aliihoeflea sp. 40Bstr573]
MKIAIALALCATVGLAFMAIVARLTPDRVLIYGFPLLFLILLALLLFILKRIDRQVDEDFLQDEQHWGGQ